MHTIIVDGIADLPGIALRRIPNPQGDIGIEVYLCLRDAKTANLLREKLDALNVNCHKTTGTYCHYAHEYCQQGQAHAPSASPFLRFTEWPAPGYSEEDFPRTNALTERFVALPIGVLYTEDDAHYIADCIRFVCNEVMQ